MTGPAPSLARDELSIPPFPELLPKDNGTPCLQNALLLWLTLEFAASHLCLESILYYLQQAPTLPPTAKPMRWYSLVMGHVTPAVHLLFLNDEWHLDVSKSTVIGR